MATTKGRIYLGSQCVFGCVALNGIGTPGAAGFGVGVFPGVSSELAALGLSPVDGTETVGHASYGNYQRADGSSFCWIPACWFRIGSTASERYATYGANAHDCLPLSAFATVEAANVAGYFRHRALIDGGQVKRGFFYAKYKASQSADGQAAIFVPNGAPISLTSNSDYTRSQGMPDCSGNLADAVTLARAYSGYSCTSIFQSDYIARLALCHAQAAASATHCAWHDASGTTNFPKGCNNDALSDVDDAAVSYTTAGDPGSAAKGLTGSGAPFAKTTHNGQPCGVADINGVMWEALLGVTNPGSSASGSAQIASGDAWVLKESVALSGLTAGWDGATDAWQSAANIGVLYDSYEGFFPWGDDTGWARFGDDAETVFPSALSGVEWLRSCCGVPAASGLSSAGSNLFGADGCYRYNRQNLFPLGAGSWYNGSLAGPFARYWSYSRTHSNRYVVFRAAAYG
ncbi:hypothetical protein [Thiococcus pfennigii]|uniref:hypothetical protein n=1 Tax=Thiococcus pfennigii TaxID=1057 RepID=UPI0019038FCF|nr:hypothetical protein [Thiococcus pfennigii]MBK1699747.1 hypothetical protein [Thiococcus pfennigii]